jgi:hypothetical protein
MKWYKWLAEQRHGDAVVWLGKKNAGTGRFWWLQLRLRLYRATVYTEVAQSFTN